MGFSPERRARKPKSRLIWNAIPENNPLIRSVAELTPRKYGRHQNDYYKAYDRAETAVNTLRSLRHGGASKEQFFDLYKRKGFEIASYESLRRFSKQAGAVSRKIKAHEVAPSSVISREDKRVEIDKLHEIRGAMFQRYMKNLHATNHKEIQKRIDESIDRLSIQWDQKNRGK